MGKVWELDFYSRPILDENNKKQWEVLICETPTDTKRSPDSCFRYTQFCTPTTVNSLWLREAIEAAIKEAGETPSKIRFFRRQMNNMIVKACEDAGIPAAPSRRTYALNQWLRLRQSEFYPSYPGYDPKAVQSASVNYPPLDAIALPDAVRGDKMDKWAFVTLEAAALEDMNEWNIGFGEGFPISLAGLSSDTPIPGLIIFSQRALPLAGWMSGLELVSLKLQALPRPLIRLETGLSDSWILVNLTDDPSFAEGQGFEATKEKAQGVHFLAIQSSPDVESFAGFWLLKEE
ncbi:Tab2/Atab2 family RNA-binding protein [Crocosphaera sp. UHCC 0190]|uniref:Tab2/Atab2 family RNA-binding protein n=1 Tax=Crocosphaera sp. UHCC 0190 TaxID=3110246 RepID=UPI002B1EF2A2|nr:Tab2/Atab2 family RNA-binding protein [Crocosphaera sp. UHCC 0190]MEA5509120.1 Tab2/Atab2 family RNA-binding protein [Crocosphaera sp. UHCC 0190]